ncbi:MAG: carbon monoxide dehydrogenase subunit G [Alphaproteobacteria bacterium]
MKIEQTFVVAAPLDAAWALIRDPEIMVSCVPGCEEIERISDDKYKAQVSVSVGPIKARFNLMVEITEERPPSFIRAETRGEEGSRASVVKAMNELHLAPTDEGGTAITYSSDVEVSGRLGRYGAGMMKKIATKLAAKFEDSFRALAEGEEMVAG